MFPVEIVGRRTVLRELTEQDAPALAALISHPEVARRVIDDQIPDETAIRELIRYSLAAAIDRHRWQYRLGVTVDAALIGSGTLTMVSREHRRGEIGYSIHPDRRGGGLATDPARSLLRLGFGLLGLHRIEATTRPDHTASRRVMEKLGMRHESVIRSHMLVRGSWVDSASYAILSTDPAARDLIEPTPVRNAP